MRPIRNIAVIAIAATPLAALAPVAGAQTPIHKLQVTVGDLILIS